MPRSPEPARTRLLDAALELFATNGIAGTSLREIRLAADQGNAGALHYHFGDKDGVLRALLERELPLLVDKRKALLADARGARELRPVAAVFVQPFAELATGTKHERWVVQFLSQLNDDVTLSNEDMRGLIGETGTQEAYELLRGLAPQVPVNLLNERVQVGLNSYLHAAAIRAKRRRRKHYLDDEAFRQNLVDMFLAALVAGY
jgi:AcrR family transcriptional regulator